MIYYKVEAHPYICNALSIEVQISLSDNEPEVAVQLPSWRPGRYEIGNFAKQINKVQVLTKNGKKCQFNKVSKDKWLIKTAGTEEILFKYEVHTEVLNAGSTYRDNEIWLINPVNSLVFVEGYNSKSHLVHLYIPENWTIATALNQAKTDKKHLFQAASYDHLADSPIVASDQLFSFNYSIDEHKFKVWFWGLSHQQFNDILRSQLPDQFKAFSKVQLATMKSFTESEFHFLMLIKKEAFYHGVEHLHSTVCVLGPSIDFFKPVFQENLLGVSSHELFHVWNVKRIRPHDMQPYNYASENYSNLGYVYEGVTTYYGDLFLYRSGVFNWYQFKTTFDDQLRKHYINYARHWHSVADASADTWLDGYVQGLYNRKTSIYTEGCLNAFMLDIKIRQASNQQFSLDDVMRSLDEHFGQKGLGYRRENLIELIQNCGYAEVETHFDRFIEGCDDYTEELRNCLNFVGLQLSAKRYFSEFEHRFGLLIQLVSDGLIIKNVAPESPAYYAQLIPGDKILSINGVKHFDLSTTISNAECIIERNNRIFSVNLMPASEMFFEGYEISKNEVATNAMKEAFTLWTKQPFE